MLSILAKRQFTTSPIRLSEAFMTRRRMKQKQMEETSLGINLMIPFMVVGYRTFQWKFWETVQAHRNRLNKYVSTCFNRC